MLTPACEPHSLTLLREMAAMRSWSAARVRKHANVEANGMNPCAPRPAAALTIVCSAI